METFGGRAAAVASGCVVATTIYASRGCRYGANGYAHGGAQERERPFRRRKGPGSNGRRPWKLPWRRPWAGPEARPRSRFDPPGPNTPSQVAKVGKRVRGHAGYGKYPVACVVGPRADPGLGRALRGSPTCDAFASS